MINRIISFTKGAPDIILERCENIDKTSVLQQVNKLAANGHRVLGFAYRYWDAFPLNPNSNEHENGLQFLGLAGIIDPPREEVFEAVKQCKSAGIVPVMITGDHPATARAIAREAGLLSGQGEVLNATEMADLQNGDLDYRLRHAAVIARATPLDKLRIVESLRRQGHAVAMTGDGVNDAPALRLADIGVAMGISGMEVAKEALDMVLADDNFSTIVAAVAEGHLPAF